MSYLRITIRILCVLFVLALGLEDSPVSSLGIPLGFATSWSWTKYCPVCGSDSVTYLSLDALRCHNSRGTNVTFSSYGVCPETKSVITTTTTTPTTPPTTITPAPLTPEECLKACPVTREFKPVCGSDGKTYPNQKSLDCQNSCVAQVHSVSLGACQEITTTTTTTTPGPVSPAQCLQMCTKVLSNEPVCGSDGKTYNNKEALACQSKCIEVVTLVNSGPCGNSLTTTTTTTAPPVTKEECLMNCPYNLESKPVCGNDGKTYYNEQNLKCQNLCVKPTTVVSNGPCLMTDGTGMSAAAQKCITDCPKTNEYNPVCGTDGKTYRNRNHLDCAIYCDQVVNFASSGPCRGAPVTTTTTTALPPLTPEQCLKACPVTLEDSPVCGSDGKTYPNQRSLECQHLCVANTTVVSNGKCPDSMTMNSGMTMSPATQKCIADCPKTNENNPVCGTDNKTYKNRNHLDCAIYCDQIVNFASSGPCRGAPVTTTTTTALPPLTPEQCLKACPVTLEDSPVCGSDGKTYPNKRSLECQHLCVADTKVVSNGKCPDNMAMNTGMTMSPATQKCIADCPKTNEYNPVCGTDSKTYRNRNHLDCAIYCDQVVNFASSGPCRGAPVTTTTTTTLPPLSPDHCFIECAVTLEDKPVCGSDGKTYPNQRSLECQNLCGAPVQIVKQGSCSSTMSPVPDPSGKPTVIGQCKAIYQVKSETGSTRAL